ncbi:hypothetical protein D3C87_2078510 [compost metagenome]
MASSARWASVTTWALSFLVAFSSSGMASCGFILVMLMIAWKRWRASAESKRAIVSATNWAYCSWVWPLGAVPPTGLEMDS